MEPTLGQGQSEVKAGQLPLLFCGLFFLCSLIDAVWIMSIGWDHSLAGAHGFRQTQTAISVREMVGQPFTLAYETPVLGPPWSIPFEFPLYQWLVANLVWATGGDIDEAGRFVSVSFFLLSLVPGYFLLKRLQLSPEARLVVLSLFLISPFYLFWSRAFLIESTALFLSLTYLAFSLAALDRRSTWVAALAMLFGILAAVVKITTFAVVLFPVGVSILHRRKTGQKGRLPSVALLIVDVICLAAIPVGLGILWTRFADAQKALNPSAAFLVSSALQQWNFGSLKQRLTPDTWLEILGRAALAVDPLVLAVCLAAVAVTRRYWAPCAACLGLYLLAPLLFVNLYYVHEYYAYGNAVFLIAAAGCGLAALVDGRPFERRVGLLLLPFVFLLAYLRHHDHYLPMQHENFTYPVALGRVIEQATKQDEVLIILGMDWAPVVPYYSGRKALMIRGTPREGLTKLPAALDQLAGYPLGAAVVAKTAVEPVTAAEVEKVFAQRGWIVQPILADDNVVIFRIRAAGS